MTSLTDRIDAGVSDEELDALTVQLRREWGSELPVPVRNETGEERQERREATQHVLFEVLLPRLNRERLAAKEPALRTTDEDALVGRVLAGMFGLVTLLEELRDPALEDVVVNGADAVLLMFADGRSETRPPLVARDRDLERVIYDVAVEHTRPFNFEQWSVDLELEPGLRFHAAGFDLVDRPYIRLRRARVMDATLDDLYEWGTLDDGIRRFLRAAVKGALKIGFTGPIGSGKTQTLRAAVADIPPEAIIATIESSWELAIRRLGRHRWVTAYQERIPVTGQGRRVAAGDLVVAAARSRADYLIVGEARSDEMAAALQVASLGQGTMFTVHGFSAVDGLEHAADLMMHHNGYELGLARRQVYKTVDVMVCVDRTTEGRFVTEVVAPFVLNDGDQVGTHVLFAPDPHAPDGRARPVGNGPQQWMLERLRRADPTFDLSPWTGRADTYQPLQRHVHVHPRRNVMP